MSISFSSHYLQEPQVSNGDFPTLFGDSYDPVTSMYEDCRLLFEAIWNNDSPFPYQEDFLQGFIPSPSVKEDFFSATSTWEGERLPYRNWGYWVDKEDTCISSCCYWDDNNNSSYAEENDENVHICSRLEGAGDSSRGEEERENYVSHYGSGESQLSWDEVPWSGQDSWFGCGREEDSTYYGRQDEYRYSYSPEDLGFFGEIFGYWPCLARGLRQ